MFGGKNCKTVGLLPKLTILRKHDARLSKFKWLGFKYETIRHDNGMKFVQYGRKSSHFILLLPDGMKAPSFLMGLRWKTLFGTKRIRTGITTKPLNLWEDIDADRNKASL